MFPLPTVKYTARESQVNCSGKHNMHTVPGKIVMFKVSKAAQTSTQLKYQKIACNWYTHITAIAN